MPDDADAGRDNARTRRLAAASTAVRSDSARQRLLEAGVGAGSRPRSVAMPGAMAAACALRNVAAAGVKPAG